MKILSSFLLFIAFCFPSYAQVNEVDVVDSSIDLHLNLQTGEQYLYSVGMNQKIVQEIMGQSMEISQQITTEYAYDVLSNDGKSIKIKASYKRMQVNLSLPQNQVEYDSDLPAEGPFAAVSDLIDKPFFIYMSADGTVTKVEGYQELVADIKLGEEFKAMLSDSALIQSMSLNIYAGKPVAMGETWAISKTMDISSMKLKSDLNYTLEGTSEDLAWINVAGEISAINSNSDFEMEFSGTQQGTLETDIKTGMISSGSISMEIDAKIIAQGFEIPMKINSEITTKGTKL